MFTSDGNVPFGIEDVGHAAGHAGAEVPTGRTDDHDPPAGHVLAAVVADALDDGVGTRVAHAEPLADHAADEQLAAGGAVGDDVAGDDVLLGRERRRRGRGWHDHSTAGEALGRGSRWRRPRGAA